MVAWVAGPWAVAEITGSALWTVVAAVALVGTPAVFSAPGDKRFTLVPTAGPIRALIEIALLLVALGASAVVWPFWARIPIAILALAMLITNGRRLAGFALRGTPGGA